MFIIYDDKPPSFKGANMSKTRRNFKSGRENYSSGSSNGKRIKELLDFSSKIDEKPEIDLTLKRKVNPVTSNHKDYLKSIRDNRITFCTGVTGTGKTHLAVGMAAEYLSIGKIDRIIMARPAVSTEEDLGFLPGDLQAKINNYLKPALDELLEFFTLKQINSFCGGKFPIIEGVAIGQIKGRNFKNSIILLDEAQDATYRQIKNLLTRISTATKIIVTGDNDQSDKFQKHNCPLTRVISQLDGAYGLGFVNFTKEDIQRDPMIEILLERMTG